MEILTSIAVGALVGGLATLLGRSISFGFRTSVAVGVLGGLLGLACDFWLSKGGMAQLAFSEILASSVGAALTLLLWIIAQRLFLGNPPERVLGD